MNEILYQMKDLKAITLYLFIPIDLQLNMFAMKNENEGTISLLTKLRVIETGVIDIIEEKLVTLLHQRVVTKVMPPLMNRLTEIVDKDGELYDIILNDDEKFVENYLSPLILKYIKNYFIANTSTIEKIYREVADELTSKDDEQHPLG